MQVKVSNVMEVAVKASSATKALLCRVQIVTEYNREGIWVIRYPVREEILDL